MWFLVLREKFLYKVRYLKEVCFHDEQKFYILHFLWSEW